MKNAIYQIVNLVNGKRYIGSAIDFRARKRNHISQLRRGKHNNKHLESSWNKYGFESFIFEIIDTVPHKSELIYREQYWIDKYDFDKELYNSLPIAGSALGFKHSKKSKEKISASNSGKKRPHERQKTHAKSKTTHSRLKTWKTTFRKNKATNVKGQAWKKE